MTLASIYLGANLIEKLGFKPRSKSVDTGCVTLSCRHDTDKLPTWPDFNRTMVHMSAVPVSPSIAQVSLSLRCPISYEKKTSASQNNFGRKHW